MKCAKCNSDNINIITELEIVTNTTQITGYVCKDCSFVKLDNKKEEIK